VVKRVERCRSTIRDGRTVRFTPPTRVYVLGGTLCVALVFCSCNWANRGGPLFIASLAAAGIAYLLAIRLFLWTPTLPPRVVIVGLILAAVWHLQFLRKPPGPDDDIHRYVWDGRVQRLGYNPYVVVPSDPAVTKLHTAETRNLNNPDLPTPYPAVAQLFFRAVTKIHESTFALKTAFVLCDFAIVFVVLDVLRRENRGRHWVLAYAWNPLLAIEVAGSGHIDIVGALLLSLSFAALGRRWRAVAAVAFGLAVAVKLLPIVLLPLYWKRVRVRDAVLTIAMITFLYLPFLNQTHAPIGSLLTYAQTWRFNDPVFGKLEQLAPPIALGVPVIVGLAVAALLRGKSPRTSPDAFAWPMSASLLCAPVVYPWYLLWLLPFLRPASTLPIVIWTVSIIPTYVVWHLRTLGHPWLVPRWVLLVEYGCVAMAGVAIVLRRLTRPVLNRPGAMNMRGTGL